MASAPPMESNNPPPYNEAIATPAGAVAGYGAAGNQGYTVAGNQGYPAAGQAPYPQQGPPAGAYKPHPAGTYGGEIVSGITSTEPVTEGGCPFLLGSKLISGQHCTMQIFGEYSLPKIKKKYH